MTGYDLRWQEESVVDRNRRAALNGHRPCVVWLTGVSGAGKSTIGTLLEWRLHALGKHTYLLDGDHVRRGLNQDLGFTDACRAENVRRIGEVAALMAEAGLVVIVALISPFRVDRAAARRLLPEGEFCEVHVDTPLEVAEHRDPKGLYARARRGEIPNFTGIGSGYEPPEHPEVHVRTATCQPEQAVEAIMARLTVLGVLD